MEDALRRLSHAQDRTAAEHAARVGPLEGAVWRCVHAVRATQPDLAGDWSLNDVVAHVTRYERWNAAGLSGAPFEPPPPPPRIDLNDMDARNDWFYELDRDLTWSAALAAARAAHAEFDALVAALPEDELQANYTIDERGELMRSSSDAA